MNEVPVRIVLDPGASPPEYKSDGASGADLRACLPEPLIIEPGTWKLVPTGLKIELPFGYEAQVRPRSGLAAKYGLSCLNTPGTIDSDYRGEILVNLVNHGTQPYTVQHGDRIAQLIVAPVSRAVFSPALSLEPTERGSGGFGSTGHA